MRPLVGFSVVEFGTYVAAPALGNMLGLLGAEVVKVEPLQGDPTRSVTPWSWANYNWNKKSVCLDLKTKEGMEAFRRLVKKSHVLIEGASPRAVKELNIGYKSMRRLNPRLIYCSFKGFASGSLSANRVGFDSIAQAEGGLMHVVRSKENRPTRVGNPCVDLAAASFGAISILSYLLKRPRKGGFIEIPLYEVVVYWNGYWFPYIDLNGREPSELGTSHPGFAPYGIYKTVDGFVFVGVLSDGHWERLVEKLSLPRDERFSSVAGRNKARVEVDGLVQSAVESLECSEVFALLGDDVPCAKVSSLMDVYADGELRKRGIVRGVSLGKRNVSVVMPPISRSLRHSPKLTDPPQLGSDTSEVLARLGYGRNSIASFREKGVIV